MTSVLYSALILPISYLPMSVLYLFSDFLSVFIFYIARYRRRVVEENLARSFPERTKSERHRIARDFYRHFADLIVESIKGFSISDQEIRSRFQIENPEILEPYFKTGRSVILSGGHYNNWEWLAIGLRQHILHRAVAIYKPLSDTVLDQKMRKTRGKYGLELLAMRAVTDFLKRNAASPSTTPLTLIFGSDQSPGDPKKAHWMRFLNQDTGFTFGAEKYAREYDFPVFFGVIHKPKRGYYRFTLSLVTDQPQEMRPGGIVEEVALRLEREIRKDPRYWLWSHRRWKHCRPESNEKMNKRHGDEGKRNTDPKH